MYPSLTAFPGDLFAELDAMQRLLGMGDWQPSSIRAAARGTFPAVNMGTTEAAVEIYAFVPGLDPARIEVCVEKGLLIISGVRANEAPSPSDKLHVYASERYKGAFRRVVGLPDEVDSTRVEASYRDGVLRVVLPKRESMKPRRVEVKGLDQIQHGQ